jgi:hypothetical protein
MRVSLNILNKYYLTKCIPLTEMAVVAPELENSGLMKRVCKADKESEFSLEDVNRFLEFLCAKQGPGSQNEKCKKNFAVLEEG